MMAAQCPEALKRGRKPMESTLQKPALVAAKTTPKAKGHRLLDRDRDLLPADELDRPTRNCACRRWRRRSPEGRPAEHQRSGSDESPECHHRAPEFRVHGCLQEET